MPNELLIYGEIGYDVSAKAIVDQLATMVGQDIVVRIASPGGNVADGLAIYNALKDRTGKTIVMIDGMAWSMASGIAMAGDEVHMAANSLLMIHDPTIAVAGKSNDLKTAAKALDLMKASLVQAYVNKTGLDAEHIGRLMEEETWLDADEALAMGFVDQIIGEVNAAAAIKLPQSYDVRIPAACLHAVNAVMAQPVTREAVDMPDTKPQEPQAATLDQLLALSGATNDFAVEQLQRKATLVEAQNALNKKLVDELEAARNEAATAKAQADQAKADAAKQSAQPPGTDAIDDQGTGDTSAPDPLATFQDLFDEEIRKGRTPMVAYQNVHRRNPGLIESVQVVQKAS